MEQINDLKIDKDFVLNTDLAVLRELLLKEDSEGRRYRERIFDEIDKIGNNNWFKSRGLPINDDSIWKNRYTGTEETLEGYQGSHLRVIKEGLDVEKEEERKIEIYLWENYLPKEIWTDKDMFEDYKLNTHRKQGTLF